MLKNKLTKPIVVAMMALVGLGGGVAAIASAQSATATPAPITPSAGTTTDTTSSATVTSSTADTPEAGDVADASEAKTPGSEGIVASINGTTIVMKADSDKGGASFTVDASKATVTNNGVTASLSGIKVGDEIEVQGTTNGTNVSATSISLGGQQGENTGEHSDGPNDAADATEPAGAVGK